LGYVLCLVRVDLPILRIALKRLLFIEMLGSVRHLVMFLANIMDRSLTLNGGPKKAAPRLLLNNMFLNIFKQPLDLEVLEVLLKGSDILVVM